MSVCHEDRDEPRCRPFSLRCTAAVTLARDERRNRLASRRRNTPLVALQRIQASDNQSRNTVVLGKLDRFDWEIQRRLELGKRQLSRYYNYYYGRWHKRVKVEYTIRQVEVDGVPLTGTIDKINKSAITTLNI